jgi:hypothetical protein
MQYGPVMEPILDWGNPDRAMGQPPHLVPGKRMALRATVLSRVLVGPNDDIGGELGAWLQAQPGDTVIVDMHYQIIPATGQYGPCERVLVVYREPVEVSE